MCDQPATFAQDIRPYVFVGGGLGDVARRFYLTNTYTVLEELEAVTAALCFSHNPAAMQFFRFHPKAGKLLIMDVGHFYSALMRDPAVPKREINSRILQFCGLDPSQELTKRREPEPIRHFHAPDTINCETGYVVVHPFGRGWGDWPAETVAVLKDVLRQLPAFLRVFVIAADYITSDGKTKRETFETELANVTFIKNLSAPATFNLVAGASRFLGNISSLAQVAAFERIPSLVLFPRRCVDFVAPYCDYSKTIWRYNGASLPYDGIEPSQLRTALLRFLIEPHIALVMRDTFRDLAPVPDF